MNYDLWALAIPSAMLIGMVAGYLAEVRAWNGGISCKSGLPWRCFATDSQGGQMFTDDSADFCEISWTHLTKDKRNVR